MPKILHNRAKAIQKAGAPASVAWAAATKQLQAEGKLKKGSQKLTEKGRKASK